MQIQTYADWATQLCDVFDEINATGGNTGGCTANGGTLSGGPFNFCVDGTPDNIPANGITLTGGSGANRGWIVTDETGGILGLPPSFTGPDFDAAGVGTCFVYYIRYEDGLAGLTMGGNINQLQGCYDLSNSVTVVRQVCTALDCPALGANIGDACNDGNANTNNDVVTASCGCAGTPAGSTTCDATYRVEGDKIIIEGLNASITSAKILTNTWATVAECSDWTTACAGMLMANVQPGDYFVQIQTYADWSTPLCDIFEEVTVTGGGTGGNGCDNVTNGGSIGGDETGCGAYNPGPITNASLATGGSGAIEYLWLSSTTGCPRLLSEAIDGANGATFDPGMITQTTYYVSCLLYTSPSPRDATLSRMPSSA